MKTATWALAAALLLANTAGTAWLILKRAPGEERSLSETTMAQADKLFKLISEFQTELQNVTAQANYPEDRDKEDAKKSLRFHTREYELARVAYSELRVKRSRDHLLRFLEVSGCMPVPWVRECSIMQAPVFKKFVPAGYDASARRIEPAKEISYGNVSKLESLGEEFEVLLVSMLRDIK
jgi:hypothetical protein